MFDKFNEIYALVKGIGQADEFYPEFDGTMKTAITVRYSIITLLFLSIFIYVSKQAFKVRAFEKDI